MVRRLDPESLGQHVDALYRAAWGLCGSREDAEDLVQETFARVLARPRAIREAERAYLMRALRNTFYSRLRSASRRPQTGAELDEHQPPDPRTYAAPEGAAEVSEILAAIAALPEDFRLAIVAVDILGLSYAEAARALDTHEATITTRLYRARQRVVRAMAEEPAEATPRGGSEPPPPQPRPPREGSDPKRSLA
ncbi:MAG: RNA polymerase sigma factor [Solirubrobacteraceae bacterium]